MGYRIETDLSKILSFLGGPRALCMLGTCFPTEPHS